jgi:predicted TIM-barrel fold metal-dependent hydrolase
VLLEDYRPHSSLVSKETTILKPRFPVTDAHNHLGQYGRGWDQRPANALLDLLDEANVRTYVDLDGGWGEEILRHRLDKYKSKVPERFCVFGGVDWSAWGEHGDRFGDWAAGRLREQVRWGAQGLKIWKEFGLWVLDQHNKTVCLEDERLCPVWETAAELQIPVMIHVGDPVAFFQAHNESNERWEEMSRHNELDFSLSKYPSFEQLIRSFEELVARHPQTRFIGAHVGCYAENLEWVERMLSTYSNFYIDISARISELGRQPYSARRLFLKFPDRILFGMDGGPDIDKYRIYYRFLETDDEYFDYGITTIPTKGRWRIYGIFLPDDVLRQVYFENAQQLIKC